MIPRELETDYFSALKQLPSLVAAAADREWDEAFLSSALSAIAAAKGSGMVAEAIQELNASVAEEFMEWFFSR
jgi:DNA-binding phage protein